MERDNFKVAKDIAWVIKSLWAGAVAVVIAAVWVTALAQEVKTNTEILKEREAVFQTIPLIASALIRIEGKLDATDKRQREIEKGRVRLEEKVERIEKDLEE